MKVESNEILARKRKAATARKRKQRELESEKKLVRVQFNGITKTQKRKLQAFAKTLGI